MITVLPDMGSEYKVKFSLLITKMKKQDYWYNVLSFTVDKGMEDMKHLKYGERAPSVFVKDNKLLVRAAVNGNPNFGKAFPLTVGKWTKIEICQHLIENEEGHFWQHN